MSNPFRLGPVLIGIGGLVGVAAVVGLATGFEPARLPPAILNLAVYKLTLIAAGGLLAAGAIVHRYSQRRDVGRSIDRGVPPAEEIKARPGVRRDGE